MGSSSIVPIIKEGYTGSIFIDLSLLCVSIFLFFYLASYKKKPLFKVPPGRKGWPIIGETWEYIRSGRKGAPEKFFHRRMADHSSEVFKTSLLGQDMAVLCGPAGNKFMFTKEHEYMDLWIPAPLKKVIVSAESPEKQEEECKELRRSLLPEFLKPDALKGYVHVMDSVAKEHLEKHWVPYNEVKVFLLAKVYTFTFGCNMLMSIKDPDHIARMFQPFQDMVTGIASLPIAFPGTPFHRALREGKRFRAELAAIIKQRRMEILENQGTAKSDILGHLLQVSDDTETRISNRIAGFLVGSYHTVSTSITFIINFIADNPHVYELVVKEQMEIAESKPPGEPLNWQDIQKMKYSWCVACETMRLMPPSRGSFREATTDFTYKGFTIPKGWKTHWSVHTTHKNPKYFPDPEKFDPSRFEGAGPAPYTYVPFGGGPRMCPGKEYARIEMLVFMHNVFTRFKISKVNPKEKIIFRNAPSPQNGLLVRLERVGN